MSLPSCGPTPNLAFFVYHTDEADQYAVYWNGNEWILMVNSDRRFWYPENLDDEALAYLLNHYGLQRHRDLAFDAARSMSPKALVDARRKFEAEKNLPPVAFKKGVDY